MSCCQSVPEFFGNVFIEIIISCCCFAVDKNVYAASNSDIASNICNMFVLAPNLGFIFTVGLNYCIMCVCFNRTSALRLLEGK